MEATEENLPSPSSSAVIFLGTGCSSAVPYAHYLLQRRHPPCAVCLQSLSLPPELNPNYRCNTSLLIDYSETNGEHNYILIDVGKTFREQVLRWFTRYNIPRLDSIILTHEHADAVLGLDDLCAILPSNLIDSVNPTPIYLSETTMLSIAAKLPHLVGTQLKGRLAGEAAAHLDWRTIETDCEKPFIAMGLQFVPLPVMHGEDYISLGFLFGQEFKVVYVSDVSRFPPTTEQAISKNGAGQVDLLILDANSPVEKLQISSRSTHFCLSQTLDAIKRIRPKQALLIGMNHDYDHGTYNVRLEEWSEKEGILVQLAYDGLRIPMQL